MFAIVTVKHINTNELKYINCVFKFMSQNFKYKFSGGFR